MKKISVIWLLMLSATFSFGKSYTEILKKINSFLVNFDGGYYGHMEIRNGQLWDYYKNGTNSHMNISDYGQASVVEVNRKVTITCSTGSSCVTGYDGGSYGNMPFSQSTDFDAYTFASDLNDLIAAYKGNSSSSSYSSSDVIADFPVGTKVRVLESNDNKNYIGTVGMVENSALRPIPGGWYVGTLYISGNDVSFHKMKVEKVK